MHCSASIGARVVTVRKLESENEVDTTNSDTSNESVTSDSSSGSLLTQVHCYDPGYSWMWMLASIVKWSLPAILLITYSSEVHYGC